MSKENRNDKKKTQQERAGGQASSSRDAQAQNQSRNAK